MSNRIQDQFRLISDELVASAKVAAGIGHPPTTGRIRELLVQKFLNPHLPRTLEVLSGKIVDSQNNISRQQDCVIVDTRLPLVNVGSETDFLLIAESAIATIEIKSQLNKNELKKTLDAIEVTRKLVRKGEQVYTKGAALIKSTEPLPILTYIFAYDGIDLNLILDHIVDYAHQKNSSDSIPESICVLQQGVILRTSRMPLVQGNNIILPDLKNNKLTLYHLKKDALFAFYKRLIDDIMTLRIVNIDLDAYYTGTSLE